MICCRSFTALVRQGILVGLKYNTKRYASHLLLKGIKDPHRDNQRRNLLDSLEQLANRNGVVHIKRKIANNCRVARIWVCMSSPGSLLRDDVKVQFRAKYLFLYLIGGRGPSPELPYPADLRAVEKTSADVALFEKDLGGPADIEREAEALKRPSIMPFRSKKSKSLKVIPPEILPFFARERAGQMDRLPWAACSSARRRIPCRSRRASVFLMPLLTLYARLSRRPAARKVRMTPSSLEIGLIMGT